MKKFFYLAACCAIVGAFASCNKKSAAATPGMAAKQYVEHIMNDDYEAFVEAVSFTQPVPAATKKAVNKAHAAALRTIHQPAVAERGGIREVKLISEKTSSDNKTCDVVLAKHYNNGVVSTVNLHMVNDYNMWKVRETPYKEIWKATTSEGNTEILKVRTGHDRDFFKEKDYDTGEKQFVKDISRRDGQVEVIKVLENGKRHREVIKTLKDGTTRDVQVK